MAALLETLLQEAGDAIFERGVGYFRAGKVSLSAVTPDEVKAMVRGSHHYRVWLNRDGEHACDCPMGDNEETCKHVVATAFAWLDSLGRLDGGALPQPAASVAKPPAAALAARLAEQSPAQLQQWLLTLAAQDKDVERQLLLWLSELSADEKTLRQQLDKLIGRPRFMDYAAAGRYSRRVAAVVDTLQRLLDRGEVAMTAVLADWAAQRLIRVMEQADDSDGGIGEAVYRVIGIWQAALAQGGVQGEALVKLVYQRCLADDYGFYEQPGVLQALNADDLAALVRRVQRDWAKLPQVPPGTGCDRWQQAPLDHLLSALACASGDVALQVAVSARDLGSAYRCLQHVELLYRLGQQREALRQLEQYVRVYPGDRGLLATLAAWLQADGLTGEALQRYWQCFLLHRGAEYYLKLRELSAADWPHWRQRAQAVLLEREEKTSRPGTPPLLDERLQLLLAEGALDEAAQLWQQGQFSEATARELARAFEAGHPQLAVRLYGVLLDKALQYSGDSFYRDAHALLQRLKCVQAPADFVARLAAIRQQHARRRKFIALIADL